VGVHLSYNHAQRRLFVVLLATTDNSLVTFADPTVQSHEDWFAGWEVGEDEPLPNIEHNVRGYLDETGIHFYKGADYRGGSDVVETARRVIDTVRHFIAAERPRFDYSSAPVFAGEGWELII
jgi:hypothetical protein